MSETEKRAELALRTFIQMVKEFNLAMAVTKDGSFVFIDIETDERVAFKAEDIETAYNKL